MHTSKSAANKAKHGIDFVEAEALWHDPDRMRLLARPTDEPRFLIVGQINQVLWTATGTLRDDNKAIRIISVRRSRDDEKARYSRRQAQRSGTNDQRGGV